jgi:hypothetical protein
MSMTDELLVTFPLTYDAAAPTFPGYPLDRCPEIQSRRILKTTETPENPANSLQPQTALVCYTKQRPVLTKIALYTFLSFPIARTIDIIKEAARITEITENSIKYLFFQSQH